MRLVPIDHGLTLPDSLEVNSFDLVWMSYSQIDQPMTQRTLDYIKAINIEEEVRFIER